MTSEILARQSSAPSQGERTPGSSTPHFFAGLDGLRGLAVAAVLVYHLFPGVLPGGFIGVDLFFVISGFLITTLLVRERAETGRVDLPRFWQRRVRRLVPALIVLVLVCSSAAWALGGDVLVGIGRQILGAATFSGNWLTIATGNSYFDQDAPALFRNLWSLAVEEQFYLIWPILLLIVLMIRYRRLRIWLVAALAAASGIAMAVLYQPGGDATRVYFGSGTHSFGLAIGAVLALVVAELRPFDLDAGESRAQRFVRVWLAPLGALGLAALGFAAWWLHDDAPATYRGGLLAVSLITAIVIWAAATPKSRLGRMLDVAPLRAVGLRSYGIYLWHWPLLVLVLAALPNATRRMYPWLPGTIALVLTVACAWASYRFVEQPIRRRGAREAAGRAWATIRDSRPRRGVAVAGLVVCMLGVGGAAAAVTSAPATTMAQQLIAHGERAIANQATPAKVTPSPVASPRAATPGRSTPPAQPTLPPGNEIVAIGDSVMLASAPELQAEFPGIQINAVVSRQMYTAPDILKPMAEAGTLRPVIVLGLGTNGSISLRTLDAVRSIIGRRELVLVSVQAPRRWTAGVNAELRQYAKADKRTVLADWKSAIASHLNLLAGDDIHPGAAGGNIYARTVRTALLRYAEDPPVIELEPVPGGPTPF